MRIMSFAAVAFAALLPSARGSDARIEVARLDGTPVYHWRVFQSHYGDDVDRALVIREFHRRGYHLPSKLADDEVAEQVARKFGDIHHLKQQLHVNGVTLDDFKQFLMEEITIAGMEGYNAQHTKDFSRARWLAALRGHAKIERLR